MSKHAIPLWWFHHNDRNPWYNQTTSRVEPPNEFLSEEETKDYGDFMAALGAWATVEATEARAACYAMQNGRLSFTDITPHYPPQPISTRQAYAGAKKLVDGISLLLGVINKHDL